MRKRILFFALVLIFVQGGCGPEPVTDGEKYRADQLALLDHIGNQLILPGYTAFAQESATLSQHMNTLVNDPTPVNLQNVREQWTVAYRQWQKVGFYNFGPAVTYAAISLNLYPVDTQLADTYAANGDYNLGTAASNFAKGFPALDYILFGKYGSDEELLTAVSTQASVAAYLSALTDNISATAGSVLNAWLPEQGNYISTFTSNPGTSSGSSLSLLVNAWSQYLEIHVRNAKVGIPNGNSVVTSERFGPYPEKAEAYYSGDRSVDLLLASLTGMSNFYMGKTGSADGYGLHDYLETINAQDGTLAGDYKAQWDAVLSAATELQDPLTFEIENNASDVTALFNELKAAVALLKVDVVSALSISINYADNDGD